MKFKLFVKPVTEKDLSSRECMFTPEDDEVEMHLDNLLEDISSLSVVSDVIREELCFHITTQKTISQKELKNKMKDFFDEVLCYVRFERMESLS